MRCLFWPAPRLMLLILFAGIFGVVMLLSSPKTRAAGVGLLALLLLLLVIVSGLSYFALKSEPSAGQPDIEMQIARQIAAPAAADTITPEPAETGADAPTPPADAAGAAKASAAGGSTVGRPSWVERPPKRVGDAYQMSITVGPYTTRTECDAELPEQLQAALARYVETYLGPEAAGRVRLPPQELGRQAVKEQWEETIQASFGPMTQLHVLLRFDQKIKDRVKQAWDRAVVTRRLWYTGTAAAVVLGLMSVLLAYLKVDETTGGAYRGRLRIAAAIAALAVAASGAAVAQSGLL